MRGLARTNPCNLTVALFALMSIIEDGAFFENCRASQAGHTRPAPYRVEGAASAPGRRAPPGRRGADLYFSGCRRSSGRRPLLFRVQAVVGAPASTFPGAGGLPRHSFDGGARRSLALKRVPREYFTLHSLTIYCIKKFYALERGGQVPVPKNPQRHGHRHRRPHRSGHRCRQRRHHRRRCGQSHRRQPPRRRFRRHQH